MAHLAHRIAHSSSRFTDFHTDLRKDGPMQHIELRLESIEERHTRLRSARAAERDRLDDGRSLRLRLGESLIRLGRRIGGDTVTTPAWQG